MDAQQRLLLEGCWEALGHGGQAAGQPAQLDLEASRAVAVAVGISYTEYYLNSAHQVSSVVSMAWLRSGVHSAL